MRVLYLTSLVDGHKPHQQLCMMPNASIVGSVLKDERLEQFPDDYQLGISFFYNYKIPSEQLSPNHVWVNFHPAPLPQYRGRNVAYHAIMNDESEFGATLHYVDKEFDTGDIIEVARFPILPSDDAGDVAYNARKACLCLFQKYIYRLLDGDFPSGVPQGKGTYYKKEPIEARIELTPEQQCQVRAFTVRGKYAPYTLIGGRGYGIRRHDDH